MRDSNRRNLKAGGRGSLCRIKMRGYRILEEQEKQTERILSAALVRKSDPLWHSSRH